MVFNVIVVEPKPTALQALEEMQQILRTAASAGTPNRLAAVRYTECRGALLGSNLRPVLPGFLLQCVSVFKFTDFISLFDPRPQARIAFIDQALEPCWSFLDARREYDVFGETDSEPEF